MTQSVEFYFDFSSPYGYIASSRIDDLEQEFGIEVSWHPYLIGATFKLTGRNPLMDQPLVGDYARIDIARTARLFDVTYEHPEIFPIMTVAACRGFYTIEEASSQKAKHYAQAVYHAYFVENRNISEPSILAELAHGVGYQDESFLNAITSEKAKMTLRGKVEKAIDKGVFGSPFFLIDDEPFWGVDHLDQVTRWLETGGW